MSKKVCMISLGCPKNRVDSEKTLGALAEAGTDITTDETAADVIIVNTCGFISESKEESVDTILNLAKIKNDRPHAKLVVMGCLSERYRDQLAESIPEIDYLYGVDDLRSMLSDLVLTRNADLPDPDTAPRVLTTASHLAYLKIAEGCSNKCSFCVIPSIRGAYRSIPEKTVIDEARALADNGVKELILVAQDSTLYGADIKFRPGLSGLLRSLVTIDAIEWIRVLYMYPSLIDDRLLDTFAREEKIAPYFDIPLQHVSDNVLSKMRRPERRESILALIKRIRKRVDGAAIRSSFIVGFPGETDADFELLLEFIKQTRLTHVGVFSFSPEEGTQAYTLPGAVAPEIARDRYNRLMEAQKIIATENAAAQTGNIVRVIVDSPCPDEPLLTGRTQTQAPEIDSVVILDSVDAQPGDIITVRITGSVEYDLIGDEVIS